MGYGDLLGIEDTKLPLDVLHIFLESNVEFSTGLDAADLWHMLLRAGVSLKLGDETSTGQEGEGEESEDVEELHLVSVETFETFPS
jgi:hypothetical protein